VSKISTLASPAVVADAALMLSEVATNAVIHANSTFTVHASVAQHRLRVEVADDDDHLPRPRARSATADNGRGLQLVEGLAAHWGAQHTPGGKMIWFELPVG
jgi:anti-sigma regulatory factor (Ser/Thr protein kinase)